MRILIIDNYDSFTWNLFDYVFSLTKKKAILIKNDAYSSWKEVCSNHSFNAVIISPGPGSPTKPTNLGLSKEALLQDDFPVLGVCLGMQALYHLYGGKIKAAKEPYHGRTSKVFFIKNELFKNIANGFTVGRYHSLIIDTNTIPSCIEVTSWTECNTPMSIKHKTKKKWGVQFHPESILTGEGKTILKNFIQLAKYQKYQTHKKLDFYLEEELVFQNLLLKEKNCFWLDSQKEKNAQEKFAFMGASNKIFNFKINNSKQAKQQGINHIADLEKYLIQNQNIIQTSSESLPFDFHGGLVGYFTYEMKGVFEGKIKHANDFDDSLWMITDQFIAFDKEKKEIYLIAFDKDWNQAQAKLKHLEASLTKINHNQIKDTVARDIDFTKNNLKFNNTKKEYKELIKHCKEYIAQGESYEICLTERFCQTTKEDAFKIYQHLRKKNKANLGAFIKKQDTFMLSFSPERFIKVDQEQRLTTKPIKGTCAKSPIKAIDELNKKKLLTEKNQAENIMIVDLMRNDLTKICKPESIQVINLNKIETLESLHQLVSTVQGELMEQHSLLDVIRALFPAGSITGAPKIRTMDIIDQLESTARGIYCGSIGYISYNKTMDLSVSIRSISLHKGVMQGGAGGAITHLSQEEDEYQEMFLKSQVLIL